MFLYCGYWRKNDMSLIENLNLGPHSFIFNYQNRTSHQHWEMFHAHQGLEFLYVHQGNGHIVFDQKMHRIQSNTLIIFQPYQLHKINMEAHPISPYVRTMFVFDPTFADPFLKPFPSLYSFFYYLWKEKLQHQLVMIPENNKLLELLSQFNKRLETTSSFEHAEEFMIFLISLLRYLKDLFQPIQTETSSRKRVMRHVEKVMEWIEHHYKEEFVLERLASNLHLSPYHISRLFREDMGCTITDYIIVKRLRDACLLLTTTSMPIQDIARKVGLKSDSYFCQLFKKHMGISPNQYRLKSKKIYSQN